MRSNIAVSIKSIASACGVSASTVSRALSDPPSSRISAAVCARIRAYAAASGYRRNPAGRSLRLCRHESISLVLPPYFTQTPRSLDFDSHVRLIQWEVVFEVIERARSFAYDVKLEPMRDDDVSFLSDKLNSSHSDGAIFLLAAGMDNLFSELSAAEFPFVTLDFGSSRSPAMFFPGLEAGYLEAVNFLQQEGMRRVGLLFLPQFEHSKVILQVLKKVLEGRGLYNQEKFVEVEDVFTLRRLLDQGFHASLDAVFCSNDAIADMLEREFAYRRIQQRPLIIGYDNNPAYSNISTIAVPRREIAKRAVDLLLGHLAGKKKIDRQTQTEIPTSFIFRPTERKMPRKMTNHLHI